jgi:FADH2 O2-dependent halogenase
MVLAAFEEDTFRKERFQPIESLQKNQLRDSDRMVSNAYRAMGSLPTWNAWTQLWLGQVLFHDLYLQRLCFNYFETGDKGVFDALLLDGRPGDDAPFAADKVKMISGVQSILEEFRVGKLDPDTAESPKHVYGWGNKDSRNVDFSDMNLVGALIGWGKTDAPKAIREELFDFKVPF